MVQMAPSRTSRTYSGERMARGASRPNSPVPTLMPRTGSGSRLRWSGKRMLSAPFRIGSQREQYGVGIRLYGSGGYPLCSWYWIVVSRLYWHTTPTRNWHPSPPSDTTSATWLSRRSERIPSPSVASTTRPQTPEPAYRMGYKIAGIAACKARINKIYYVINIFIH